MGFLKNSFILPKNFLYVPLSSSRVTSCPNLPGTERFPGIDTFWANVGTVLSKWGLLVNLFSQLLFNLTPGNF